MKDSRIQAIIFSLLLVIQTTSAQVVLNFDPTDLDQPTMDKAYFQTWLPNNDYKGDNGYFASLLDNPFFYKTASEGTKAVRLQQMNNGVPVRDTYFGIATWATTAQFDNVIVTDADGKNVYADQFQNFGNEWNQNGGTWVVEDGMMKQTDVNNLGSLNVCYQSTGHDATIELDATKLSGAEGFLIAFSYIDSDNYAWWNIGGWGNSQHAIEQCIDGQKKLLASAPGSIETNKTYHLKVEMLGELIRCYIDDTQIHEIRLDDSHTLYGTAGMSDDSKTIMVRVANPGSQQQRVVVRLKDADMEKATLTRMSVSGSFTKETLDNLVVGTPQQSNVGIVNDYAFSFNAQARSLNTLKLSVDALADDISEINEDIMETDNPHSTRIETGIYDLTGRRYDLPIENLRPGIYIISGQKILVR